MDSSARVIDVNFKGILIKLSNILFITMGQSTSIKVVTSC